jgi:hypothetical protein
MSNKEYDGVNCKVMEWKEYDGVNCKVMEWRNDLGKLHREGGPAHIKKYNDGVIYESFFYHDDFHRKDGPARTWINVNNPSYYKDEYWYCGMYLSEGKEGFWNLWNNLNEEERENPNILKLLIRYA